MRDPDSVADHMLVGHEPCPDWVARIMAGEVANKTLRGTATQRTLVATAKQYIAARPGERVRLADVGQALGVSPVYVTDVFRRVEGVPFYRYVLRKRLEHAVRLLPGYPSDLSTLAQELDFSSHSHFTTAFRRAFGCTPAVFRDRARRVCKSLRSSASQRVETPNRLVAGRPARPTNA
jgi:AraC-like DNA-binding protein